MQFDKDIVSQHKVLFQSARKYLLKKGLDEQRKERITTYSFAGAGICHMRTMPHGIDFGFLKGIHLEDDFKRLQGNGKVMRVLPMQSFEKDVLDYYVDQAIVLTGKEQ